MHNYHANVARVHIDNSHVENELRQIGQIQCLPVQVNVFTILRVCKNVSSKNKGRCRDGAVSTCKVKPPGIKTVGTRRKAGPCKTQVINMH